MPYITGRFAGGNVPPRWRSTPKGVIYEIQKMYYDTAVANS